MDDDLNVADQQALALNILDYWHKIEFFESTDLKELEDDAAGVLRVSMYELTRLESLPWIDVQQVRRAGGNYFPHKHYSYELFFGIFERCEIFQRASRLFAADNEEWQYRSEDEGRTCSVKCKVGSNGVIVADSFEFSTVSWALGKLEAGQASRINLKTWEAETEKLRQRFGEIVNVADNLKREHGFPTLLTNVEIIEFLKAMEGWTHFSPEIEVPALYIRLREEATRNKAAEEEPVRLSDDGKINELILLMHNFQREVEPAKRPADTGAASSAPPQRDIPILNSFYLRDIERAMASVSAQAPEPTSPLGRFLSNSRARKADLLLPESRAMLLDNLRLSALPAGRWPSAAEHNMSLMQQFAINTLSAELADAGLYSVNGPPGTGKTTMLRDLIAANLVARAEVLAGLDAATEAFSGALVATVDGKTHSVPLLLPALTGFEMVVVSSNNAAVKNISGELPQKKSLGEAWKDAGYLQPAAQKLAATHRPLTAAERAKGSQYNGKACVVEPLTEEQACWGLVAAALGNQKNRTLFSERLFYRSKAKCHAVAPADGYCTLVETINEIPAGGFARAKADFLSAKAVFDATVADLQRLEALPAQQQACARQQARVDKLSLRLSELDARLAKLRAREPVWFSLQIKRRCLVKTLIGALARRREAVSAEVALQQQRYQVLWTALLEETQHCESLQQKYPDAIFAGDQTAIEEAEVQRTAFGHCHALNAARSTLMVNALDLHQAWLAEAYKKSHLSDAFFILIKAVNGQLPQNVSLALWQLLFMVVPVISSTFASVSRQFASFGPGDIGWLFIDEAGQATPQQAVGALWRAQRAVVVGDPLQIEPVFTIPPAFVEEMAKQAFGKSWQEWSPTTQSVQTLADRVNPYGTGQIAQGTWLGSPLRVHRRCDEPMFSIANEIAYNNKMLHGKNHISPQEHEVWGHSCWFDIAGEVDGKHFVPAQAQHVLEMIRQWVSRYGCLPDVYIISPFRKVKDRLKAYLRDELRAVPDSGQWISERIGTVHTFQGKEEKTVIFVLGLSASQSGAAGWASSKPNLLNVAVTRAQKQLYIVGSKAVWAGCPFFNEASGRLE